VLLTLVVKLLISPYKAVIVELIPSMVVGFGSYHPNVNTPFSLATFGSKPEDQGYSSFTSYNS